MRGTAPLRRLREALLHLTPSADRSRVAALRVRGRRLHTLRSPEPLVQRLERRAVAVGLAGRRRRKMKPRKRRPRELPFRLPCLGVLHERVDMELDALVLAREAIDTLVPACVLKEAVEEAPPRRRTGGWCVCACRWMRSCATRSAARSLPTVL